MRVEAELNVLYELPLERLVLFAGAGAQVDVTHALANGRANYIMFERLVGDVLGLEAGTQSRGADLRDGAGRGYEVKAYYDAELHPDAKCDLFQTSASKTFGANSVGPVIKRLLDAGDYAAALAICEEAGYAHNDFYIYTNTRQFMVDVPLRFIVLPTDTVRALLSAHDPRQISRASVLGQATKVVDVPAAWMP